MILHFQRYVIKYLYSNETAHRAEKRGKRMPLTRKKLSGAISAFLNSDAFIFLYSVFVLGVSFFDCNELILSVILLVSAFIFATQRDLKPLFVPISLSYYAIRFIEGDFTLGWFFFVSAGIFVCTLFYYIAQKRPSFRPTGNLKAVMPYAASYVLAGSFAANYMADALYIEQISMLALLVPVMALFILLAANSTFEKPEYVFKLLFAMGAVVSLQIFITAATTEHFWDEVFVQDAVKLNWGVYNGIVTVLLFSIPACFYLAAKYMKVSFFFVVAAFLFTLAGVFTASRAAIMALAPYLFVCLIATLAVIKGKDRFKLLCSALFCIGAAAAALIACFFAIEGLWDQVVSVLTAGGFDLGRSHVWADSIRFFLENPLFGLGLMHHHDVPQGGIVYGFWLSHNSLYQALSSLGMFGFVCLMIHNIYKFKTFAKADFYSFFCMLAVIGTELYGLIDCLMPAPYYVLPLFLLILSADRVNLQNERRLSFGRRKDKEKNAAEIPPAPDAK